jgi:hypothetical protein
LVNLARNPFLASARLTDEQDSAVGWGDQLDLREYIEEDTALPY